MLAVPDVGRMSPTRILIVVVLPAPFGPISPRICPALQGERQVVQRRERPVLLRQMVEAEHGLSRATRLLMLRISFVSPLPSGSVVTAQSCSASDSILQ